MFEEIPSVGNYCCCSCCCCCCCCCGPVWLVCRRCCGRGVMLLGPVVSETFQCSHCNSSQHHHHHHHDHHQPRPPPGGVQHVCPLPPASPRYWRGQLSQLSFLWCRAFPSLGPGHSKSSNLIQQRFTWLCPPGSGRPRCSWGGCKGPAGPVPSWSLWYCGTQW